MKRQTFRLLLPDILPGGNVLVSWVSSSGQSYTTADLSHFQLLGSTNLTDWAALGGSNGLSNGAAFVVVPITNQPAMFYRVRQN